MSRVASTYRLYYTVYRRPRRHGRVHGCDSLIVTWTWLYIAWTTVVHGIPLSSHAAAVMPRQCKMANFDSINRNEPQKLMVIKRDTICKICESKLVQIPPHAGLLRNAWNIPVQLWRFLIFLGCHLQTRFRGGCWRMIIQSFKGKKWRVLFEVKKVKVTLT